MEERLGRVIGEIEMPKEAGDIVALTAIEGTNLVLVDCQHAVVTVDFTDMPPKIVNMEMLNK